jgi:RNA polymerase sigma-70 factor (ECF subfamily)
VGHHGRDDCADRDGADDEERALMARVRDGGDLEAFAELAGRYRGPLRRFVASLLPGDPQAAEDGAQEALLRLWASRERFDPDAGRLSSYLFGIALNWANNQRARRATRARHEHRPPPGGAYELDGADQIEVAAPPVTQPERVLLLRWERERVLRALDALPEGQRRVFALSHFDGLKYAEIAGRLGIPVGTVKSRMAEAVRRLRQALTDDEEDEEGRDERL